MMRVCLLIHTYKRAYVPVWIIYKNAYSRKLYVVHTFVISGVQPCMIYGDKQIGLPEFIFCKKKECIPFYIINVSHFVRMERSVVQPFCDGIEILFFPVS